MITGYFTRRDWCLTAAVTALVVAQVYLDLSLPGYMSDMTDALQRGGGPEDVASNGRGMAVTALLSLCCALGSGALASLICVNLAKNLRELEFDRVGRFSKQDVDGFRAESLITRSTNDVYQVQQAVGRGLTMVIKAPILAVWAVLKISGGGFQWTAATAVAVTLLMTVCLATLWATTPLFRRIQWLTDGVNKAARDDLDGMRTIRAYNAGDLQSARFDSANDALLENNLSAARRMAFMFPAMGFTMNVLTLSIYLIGAAALGGAAGQEERMDIFTDSIVFTSYALQVISAFLMMYGILRMLPRAGVSYRRIDEVIGHEPSVKDPVEGGEGDETGTVEFRDVTFTYPGSSGPAVEHISFRAERGERVAVIGTTGSGKSTLISLMERFYDVDSGSVLIDGLDVRSYSQEDLRRRMGYVPQQAVVLSGTVRYNVAYGEGSEDAGDEEVMRALRIAQAAPFVEELEGGLDARISQHGRNLSGGQRQRIAIARAVCRDPEIYLLDDCFSALDYGTDKALRETLRKEAVGRTSIIVAQRIGTVMDADRIVVLDGGRQVGYGTHAELMENCQEYREIAGSQTERGDERRDTALDGRGGPIPPDPRT